MELLAGKIPTGSSVSVDINTEGDGLDFKTKEAKGKK